MNLGLATRLSRQGRGGDTLVAHINPQEALILKLLGGSGSRNPKTGLLEFKYGSDTNEGGAHGFGGAAGGTGAGQARSGGPMGGTGAAFKGMDSEGHISRSGVGSATAADAMVAKSFGLTNDQYDKATVGFRNSLTDSYDDGLGGLLGLLGLHERTNFDDIVKQAQGLAPGAPAPASMNNAGWSFDALGAALGLAGLATGYPAGTIYRGLKYGAQQAGLIDPDFGEIGLGNDVFGGSQGSSPSATTNSRGQLASGSGPGNLNDVIGRIAAARDGIRARADARPPSPSTIPALTVPALPPDLPSGLFSYLAQNAGQLAGYGSSSRFGAGTVAPITYLRPIA